MGKKKARPELTSAIYQLKVALQRIRPPIWRRLEVPDCDLAELHEIIQPNMGWYNCHLHSFRVGQQEFATSEEWELGMLPETNITLGQIVAAGHKKIGYEYDFGDGWGHVITIEKVLERKEGVHYPRCVAGKRACPPEDCGGPWGYERLLATLADPSHEEHANMLEWVGGQIDPEAFDLQGINARMRTWS